MSFNYVFFDLDGTLTDPGIGITNSVRYALKKFNIDEPDRTKLYKFIGPPLLDSFREFYGFSEEDAYKGLMFYREYFGDRGIFENKVYDGIPEMLQKLRMAGFKLCIATSKPTEYTIRILDKFDLHKYFDYVSGSNMNEKNSNKAMIIREALTACDIDAGDVLMVGDRKHDILGAKENNMFSAGVLYGYGGYDELKNSGADLIFDKVEDIGKLNGWRGDELEKRIHT